MPPAAGTRYAYDDAPLRAFHVRVAIASFGGVFSDGYELGVIGIALAQATPALQLDAWWLGLLGGGSLAGLFFGALFTGPVADRYGRHPIFAYNMLLLAFLAVLQFFVTTAMELFLLRLAIGFLLGTDYVVSKALLTEFTPKAFRGRIMSLLSVAWAAGYTCAYFAGYLLTDVSPDAWRWILASSALPCLAMVPQRLMLPESPVWLSAHGHLDRAAAIVARHVGPLVAPPGVHAIAETTQGRWAQLWSPKWRQRTLVAAVFFTCQVIPYFALGTFVSRVLRDLRVGDGFVGGLAYNLALLTGTVLGLWIVDRVSRRAFLVGSFTITALALVPMVVIDNPHAVTVVLLFAVFALVLSSVSSLCYVYLPELFPTHLRASGIGIAIAASRIGSAVSTFLLPVVVSRYGVQPALGACSVVLAAGALFLYAKAPETRGCSIAAVPVTT
jgi:putative MFS transporter